MQTLTTYTASLTTAMMFSILDHLEAKITGDFLKGLSEDEVMVRHAVIAEVESRHDIDDALDAAIELIPEGEKVSIPALYRDAMARAGQTVR